MEWSETGDTSGPVTVKIDLTNVCNHDCPGCIDYELIKDDNNTLSLELLESLLKDLKKVGVKGINYTGGGEPTVHPEFTEIIKLTHNLGFEIGLICNGSRFHRLPMEELLPMMTWVRISLDAFDSETHKRTHGTKANFKLTVDNIKMLTSLKKKIKCDTTIGVGYITNQFPDMDRQIDKFIEVCKDAEVDYAQLRPSFGFLYDYKSITKLEWQDTFRDLKDTQTENFKVFIDEDKFEKILNKETDRSYSVCHAQSFKSTSITATGDVYICCSLSGNPHGHVGNIKKEDFITIWNSDERQETLKKLDVSKCPALCVGDNLNEFLDKLTKQDGMHKNFL